MLKAVCFDVPLNAPRSYMYMYSIGINHNKNKSKNQDISL